MTTKHTPPEDRPAASAPEVERKPGAAISVSKIVIALVILAALVAIVLKQSF